MLKKRPIALDRLMATTTASQGAWNTGSSRFALDRPEAVHAAEIVDTVHVTSGSQGHAVAERDPRERREDPSALMKEHVSAKILDGGGDAVPEPLLVGNRCLTRLHLHEEVDVTAPEIVACSRPEETSPRGGTEDLPHRGPDRLDLVGA